MKAKVYGGLAVISNGFSSNRLLLAKPSNQSPSLGLHFIALNGPPILSARSHIPVLKHPHRIAPGGMLKTIIHEMLSGTQRRSGEATPPLQYAPMMDKHMTSDFLLTYECVQIGRK